MIEEESSSSKIKKWGTFELFYQPSSILEDSLPRPSPNLDTYALLKCLLALNTGNYIEFESQASLLGCPQFRQALLEL